MEIASADLAELRELYGRGLYVQACSASHRFGPLHEWEGTAARLLGGRIAIQVGAPRCGRLMHLRAYRNSPNYPEAIYYHARYRLERQGPLATWQFIRGFPEWNDVGPELRADWFAFHGFVAARMRDFDRAERWLNRAETLTPGKPWLCIERSAFLEFAERFDEAMDSARRSLELSPWFRPGVQAVAHLLQIQRKPKEAIDLLLEACNHIESGIVVAQLAGLQMDLRMFEDARRSYERYAEWSPLLEDETRKWLDSRRADAAYFLGDIDAARDVARRVDEPFYREFAERLEPPLPEPARVALPLSIPVEPSSPMIPTTPSTLQLFHSLFRFWKISGVEPKLPEVYPFDGLPDFHEREWADENGWYTAEFTVTSESARSLIDAGVPFLLTTVDSGYGHSQLVIGYDRVRHVLLLTDSDGRSPLEGPIAVLLDRYRFCGPRGFALVPIASREKLESLTLPDAEAWHRLHQTQVSLGKHRREEAGQILASLDTEFPEQRITKLAHSAVARYDAKPVDMLAALDSLLKDFPNEPTFMLGKLATLREMGRFPERNAILRTLCADHEAEPLVLQHLAQALLPDVRERAFAQRLLNRAIRRRPFAAPAYYLLANLYWEERQFTFATDAYRFASSLDERDEQLAEGYFRAARSCDQLPEAMRFLQVRFQRMKTKLSAPARALFYALTEQEEIPSAFEVLEQGVRARPDDGELLLFLAEMRTNYDEPDIGLELIEKAKGKVAPNVWRRTAARLAAQRIDLHEAARLWREVLADEPLALDAYRNLARLIAETEGRVATMTWLRADAEKHPHNYPLWQLVIDWYRGEQDVDSEPIIRHLLSVTPRDAWVRRELALYLGNLGRIDEAIAELELSRADEPDAPSYYYSLGHVTHKADRINEAKAIYRQAIRLSVDNDVAVNELITMSRGQQDREEAIELIAEELRSQHHFGEGLMAFRDQALNSLDPDDLHDILHDVLDKHPEMWQAWSVTIQQMGMMGRYEEGLALARDAVSRFPLLSRLWVDLAEVQQARSDIEGQIEALRMAIQVSPGWSVASRELADALEQNSQPEDARAALELAIARTPMDPVNHGYLAEMLWNAGDSEEALERVSRAVFIDPGYEWAWRTLGDWAQRLEKPDELIDVARKVARVRSGDPRTWLSLARVLNGRDQADEAIHALDRAVMLNPRSVEAHDLKAERLTEMGRFDEAKVAASPELFAGDPPLTLQGRLAWIEARRGNFASAIPPMQALVAIEPSYYWGWQQLAEWHNELGRPAAYLEAASELVRLRPESPVALAMRGEARLQTGDRDDGKADLREAQKIAPNYAFAGMLLFDAYFADEEWREARSVLAVLQEHLGGPFVAARQTQLAVREDDKEHALEALRDVCRMPTEGSWPVQTAINSLRSAGWSEDVDEVLREAWEGDEPFHPWIAIAWIESQAGQQAEFDTRIQCLDLAIGQNPRFVQGIDYKAELLARVGRFDEAIATCRPTPWGDRIPITLRGREAWIIALRGERSRAIEIMKKLLDEDPDYYWGWKEFARWHDLNDSYREYLHASEQLVRLAPSDAMSFSHRGEAKRYLNDREGAKEDFRKAFELDPDYAFAGLRLLDEQIESDELDAATTTLVRLQEHIGGPYVAYGAVQLAVKQKDESSALEAFRDLATEDEATFTLLHKSLELIVGAGWQSQLDIALRDLMEDSDAHTMVGRLWVEREMTKDEWAFVEKLPKLIESGPIGYEALLTYIDLLGTPSRGSRLPAVLQQFNEVLRKSNQGWAKVGVSLVMAKQYSFAVAWLADWKERKELEPWMLHPLTRGLLAMGRFDEAYTVSQSAAKMHPDATSADHEVWLALEDALAGRTEQAGEHLDGVDDYKLDDVFGLLYTFAESLVMVQEAGPESRPRIFKDACEDIVAKLEAVKPSDLDDGFAKLYQRVVKRLARDAGGVRAWWWGTKQRMFPTKPGGK